MQVLHAFKLTHYQTTNFRLFFTERVSRRQFQIRRKWQKVIKMGRKHCGKNILEFIFNIDRNHREKRGKVRKGENDGYQRFLLFLQRF